MIVRAVEPSDVEAWAAMRARLWPGEDRDELAREASAFFDAEHAWLDIDAAFIADDGGEPLGFLELSIRRTSDGCTSSPVPHVEAWYVEASARGTGVGRALLHAAEDWASARGFVELASDAELDNVDSQRAHEACGFEEVDRLVKFRKPLGANSQPHPTGD